MRLSTVSPKVWVLILAVSISLVALQSCSSPKQRTARDEALRSLRKIDSAVEVGVNYLTYRGLLIEAKASVNEALRLIKNEKLRIALNNAMGYYEDAGELWDGDDLDASWNTISPSDTSQWRLVTRNRLVKEKSSFGGEQLRTKSAVQQLWAKASRQLASL